MSRARGRAPRRASSGDGVWRAGAAGRQSLELPLHGGKQGAAWAGKGQPSRPEARRGLRIMHGHGRGLHVARHSSG